VIEAWTSGWGIVSAAVGVLMLALWARQLRTRNATSVDVAWALCLAGSALLFACFGTGDGQRRVLLASLVGVAMLRLAWYLHRDRARSGIEDGRYAALRRRFGPRAAPGFLLVYLAQALVAALLSLPFALAAWNAEPLGALDAAACALWCVGLWGEQQADRQLARFRARPENRGRTCRTGLWRLSRHPNYFFQWTMSCAYALLAVGAPQWPWALVGPLVLLVLILFVSGIPPTEAQALRSRGDDYRRYQRSTSAFVPWFPRREEAL